MSIDWEASEYKRGPTCVLKRKLKLQLIMESVIKQKSLYFMHCKKNQRIVMQTEI